ncbi:MAG: lysylphosphatidylglycerol synthase transmembrane domain-containing protein [Candidatus Hodarchaeales archaeon]
MKKEILSLLAGIVIFVITFYIIGFEKVWASLLQVNLSIIVLTCGIYLFVVIVKSLRWKVMAKQVNKTDLSISDTSKIELGGLLFGNILPRLGAELVKVHFLRKVFGVKAGRGLLIATVAGAIELGIVIGLALVGSLYLLFGGYAISNIIFAGVASGFLIVFAGILVLLSKKITMKILSLFKKISKFFEIFEKIIEDFYGGVKLVNKSVMIKIIGITLAIWILDSIRMWILINSFGLDIPLLIILMVYPIISISIIVPTSGGLGVQEAVGIVLYGLIGITGGIAAAIVLSDRIIKMIIEIGGGSYSFYKLNK